MTVDRYTDKLLIRGKCQPSFSFLVDSFLQSRIATDHESNREYFDEDVNVYLTLLLNSMVRDDFHQAAVQYVVGYESDLPEILDRADSSYMKYQVYRMNADYLLLQTGLFQVPEERDTVDRKLLDSIERGKTYYRFACSFTEKIPARYRPVSGVLAKLSYGFDVYREILSFMRGEFLNLVAQLGDWEMGSIYRDLDGIEKTETLKVARDKLLDAYLAYKKKPSEEAGKLFRTALEELRLIDPDSDTQLSIT